jgi:GNAT superfamily N-acetyltransferase
MPTLIDRYPEMVCRARAPALAGDVRPVEDRMRAAAYWEICDQAYPSLGFPSGVFAENYEPEALLGHDDVWACLAFDHERPVACASVYMAQGVGFVGWVAALPEARGRGFAAACTARVTNRAFELGGEVASLQASAMAEEIYRRLGYEELFAYRVFGALPA